MCPVADVARGPLDVERLARAMHEADGCWANGSDPFGQNVHDQMHLDAAASLAREYAALTPDPNPETTE